MQLCMNYYLNSMLKQALQILLCKLLLGSKYFRLRPWAFQETCSPRSVSPFFHLAALQWQEWTDDLFSVFTRNTASCELYMYSYQTLQHQTLWLQTQRNPPDKYKRHTLLLCIWIFEPLNTQVFHNHSKRRIRERKVTTGKVLKNHKRKDLFCDIADVVFVLICNKNSSSRVQ